jgi:hypothetical protein
MLALINAALTVVPLVLICITVRLLMKRRNVDLSDVQKQAGPNRRPPQGLPSRLLAHRRVRPPQLAASFM